MERIRAGNRPGRLGSCHQAFFQESTPTPEPKSFFTIRSRKSGQSKTSGIGKKSSLRGRRKEMITKSMMKTDY